MRRPVGTKAKANPESRMWSVDRVGTARGLGAACVLSDPGPGATPGAFHSRGMDTHSPFPAGASSSLLEGGFAGVKGRKRHTEKEVGEGEEEEE